MAEIQLHQEIDELLDLVVTSKGSDLEDSGAVRIASSTCTSSTCCKIIVV
ncbi:MAG TPA: hypothetical protein VK669_04515 [Candidatus Limnocylindrales bacterium]|nr:hypothetical protein [Candidatus Limnocylindrales bacterium]